MDPYTHKSEVHATTQERHVRVRTVACGGAHTLVLTVRASENVWSEFA